MPTLERKQEKNFVREPIPQGESSIIGFLPFFGAQGNLLLCEGKLFY
jgi:hypothetical protein